jgi:AAHS family 4-hydroxybenzoate transporter-like MFS transporter
MAITAAIIFVPVGGMLAGVFASVVLASMGWRALFAIGGSMPIVLSFPLMAGLVESPRWLAEKAIDGFRLRKVLSRVGKPVPDDITIVPDSASSRQPATNGFVRSSRKGDWPARCAYGQPASSFCFRFTPPSPGFPQ